MTETKAQDISTSLPVAKLAWREKNNERSQDNYGDDNHVNAVRNSLAGRQWHKDFPVPVYAITPEDLLSEKTDRQIKWDLLKTKAGLADAKVEDKVALELFEKHYTHVKDAGGVPELIEPEYDVNAGFRRGRNWFAAMVQRATKKPTMVDPTPDTTVSGLIPVRITSYTDEADRIIDQQKENELQEERSSVKMSDLDKLRVTFKLYRLGCRESRIRELYSSTLAQKCFGVCRLNGYFPSLNLYERLAIRKSGEPGWLKLKSIEHGKVIKLNARAETDRKRREGIPLNADDKSNEPLPADEVEQYFISRTSGDENSNATKIMKKTDMQADVISHPLEMVKTVFDSVLNDTKENLKPLIAHADGLNASIAMVKEGKGDTLDKVMVATKSQSSLMERVAKVIAAGKADQLSKLIESLEDNAPILTVGPTPVPTPAPVGPKIPEPKVEIPEPKVEIPEPKVEIPEVKNPEPTPPADEGKGSKNRRQTARS